MRVKPFLHVELELIFGMLVLEDIGHLPGTLVIRCGGLIERLGGGLQGCGRSSRIGGGCRRWWQESELGADREVGAWWGLGR